MNPNSETLTRGAVEIIIEYKNGDREVIDYRNTVLQEGRRALALTLANQLGTDFEFFINRMIFGDGGTLNGVKRYVDSGRQGLFGITRVSKPVLANLNSNINTQVIFTSVIKYEEAVGVALSEMALQMANGKLFSMVTFPDLTKTAEMQIVFNWNISFI